jgi:hypothetical protein
MTPGGTGRSTASREVSHVMQEIACGIALKELKLEDK